jgi:hypothetical protein
LVRNTQAEPFDLKELERIGGKAGVGEPIGAAGAFVQVRTVLAIASLAIAWKFWSCFHAQIAVTQTIKEVVQSLVDDCRVSMEKIGAKNFFYAFPSTTYRNLMNRTEKLEEDIAGDQAHAEAATAESATLEADRGESEERAAAEARLAALEAEQAELEAKLKVHADNDPAVLERLADNVLAAKQGADRWTDNVFSMRQMCVTKFNTDAKQFDRMMGITDSFDYVT